MPQWDEKEEQTIFLLAALHKPQKIMLQNEPSDSALTAAAATSGLMDGAFGFH